MCSYFFESGVLAEGCAFLKVFLIIIIFKAFFVVDTIQKNWSDEAELLPAINRTMRFQDQQLSILHDFFSYSLIATVTT